MDIQNTTILLYSMKDQYKESTSTSTLANNITTDSYDSEGAMYFAVIVILMYGISIALLIGSTIRQSASDYEVKHFLKSFVKIDRQKKRIEKSRVCHSLITRNIMPMFPGCTLTAVPLILDRHTNIESATKPEDNIQTLPHRIV